MKIIKIINLNRLAKFDFHDLARKLHNIYVRFIRSEEIKGRQIMSKGFKTVALIFVLILLVMMSYNIFSGTNNPNVNNASISESEETPFYVSLLLSWVPFTISIVFYILYLQCFKKIIRIGERIAVALEAKENNPHPETNQ